ncbi:MAG: hypothetical protein Q9165_003885 [Trypethelium subeluteriae]
MSAHILKRLEQYNYISVMLQDQRDYNKRVEALLKDNDDIDVVENILREEKLQRITSLKNELSGILSRIVDAPENAPVDRELEGNTWMDREQRERDVRSPGFPSEGRAKNWSDHPAKEIQEGEATNMIRDSFGGGSKPTDRHTEEMPPLVLPKFSSLRTIDKAQTAESVESHSESRKKEQSRKKRKRSCSPPMEWVYINGELHGKPPTAFTKDLSPTRVPEMWEVYERVGEERGAKRPRSNVEDPVEEEPDLLDSPHSLLSPISSFTPNSSHISEEPLPFFDPPSLDSPPEALGASHPFHSWSPSNPSYGPGNSPPSYHSPHTPNQSYGPRGSTPSFSPPPHRVSLSPFDPLPRSESPYIPTSPHNPEWKVPRSESPYTPTSPQHPEWHLPRPESPHTPTSPCNSEWSLPRSESPYTLTSPCNPEWSLPRSESPYTPTSPQNPEGYLPRFDPPRFDPPHPPLPSYSERESQIKN